MPENRLLRLPVYFKQSAGELSQSISAAADAGFHGITVPLALGGLPIFPSDLPARNDLQACLPAFKKRDVLGEIVSQAERLGLRVYAGASPWGLSGDPTYDRAKSWFRKRLEWFAKGPKWRGMGRVPQTTRGFCPLNQEARRYWGDLMAEAAEAYPLAGLSLEMMDAPFTLRKGRERCFCSACQNYAREQFDLDLNHLHANLHREDFKQGWMQLQAERAQNWLGYFRQRIHRARRGLLVRLRTKSITEPLRDNGQGPPSAESMDASPDHLIRPLLTQGFLDGLVFNDLHLNDPSTPETMELNLAIWPDDSILYPSIIASSATELCEGVERMRQMPFMGFEVEWVGPITAAAASQTASSCFSQSSVAAEHAPLESIGFLLDEVTRLSQAGSGVQEFLSDLLTFARSPSGVSALGAVEALVENLRGLEARILQGQVDFGEHAPMALCRLSQAKRLARLASFEMGI